ncbi:MAG: CinA family protein [Aggregatilineales bacterium]
MMSNLQSLEEQIGLLLTESGKTVGTAESCTGGLIASRLTDIAGSSRYVLGGVVVYSNAMKQQLLGVQEATLIQFGAVSEQTAAEMAVGARKLLGVDYALSVTGIAGPGGGTDDKPVGLTYIGIAGADGLLEVRRFVWDQDRIGNKSLSVDAALHLLLEQL